MFPRCTLWNHFTEWGERLSLIRQCQDFGSEQAELRIGKSDLIYFRGPVYNGEFDPGSG